MDKKITSESQNMFDRSKVIIIYSHKDVKYLQRLNEHLAHYRRNNMIDIWDDTRIKIGENWYQEIKKAIQAAKIAVLLISADFLASDFIAYEELPQLLISSEIEGTRILPVIVGPCIFEETNLNVFQAFNSPSEPLNGMTAYKRDRQWAKLAKTIKDISIANTADTVFPENGFHRQSDLPIDIYPISEQFVGRKEEIRWLKHRLRRGGVTGISAIGGMGGIGKTALARHVTWQLHKEGNFQDGIVFLSCLDKQSVVEVICDVLGKFNKQHRRPETDNLIELREIARTLFDKKSVLIVLDNVEPELNIKQVMSTLNMPSLTFLLTARQPLEEVVLPQNNRKLELLPLKKALDVFAKSLGKYSARNFNSDELDFAKKIVEALDRHTLAVKLVGSYAITRPNLRALVEELKNSPLIFELPEGNNAPRAVEKSFELSFNRLPEEAQKLFTALAAFASASFGRMAALALSTALRPRHQSPRELLDLLVRRTLVEQSLDKTMPEQGDYERMRLHPLLRDFASLKLAQWQTNDKTIAYRAIAEYYAQYTESMPLEVLSKDNSNIVGSLEWAISHQEMSVKEVELVATLCSHMHVIWRNTGRTNEGLKYLPQGRSAALYISKLTQKREDILREAELALAHGQALRRVGELEQTEEAFSKDLEICQKIQDIEGEGIALSYLGRVAQSRGHLKEAQNYCQKALAIHRDIHNKKEEAVDLASLGEISQTGGHFKQASEFLNAALTIQLDIADHYGEGITLCFLGINAHSLGEMDIAQQFFEQTISITRKTYYKVYEGVAHRELGYLAYIQTNYKAAEYHYDEALQIANETLDRQSQIVLWSRMALLLTTQGKIEQADAFYRNSIDMGNKNQYFPRAADAMALYGNFLIEHRKDKEEGRLFLQKAQKIFEGFNSQKSIELLQKLNLLDASL